MGDDPTAGRNRSAQTDRTAQTSPSAQQSTSGIPAGVLVALLVALLALPGIGARYHLQGGFSFIHCLFILFFSLNLLICYWEVCLYFRWDHIRRRAAYWRRRQRETGRSSAVEFLTSRVPLSQALSPTVWADSWAAYSPIDSSYTDRSTLGFTVDIGNGFVTPIPTLLLYAAFSVGFLPPVVAGIVGVALFWQWAYVSSLYWVSFFVAGRHARVPRRELFIYVGAVNAVWVLFGVFGFYVSTRMILDGSYAILG